MYQNNNNIYSKRGRAKLSTCSVLASTRVTKPAPNRDVVRLMSQAKPIKINMKNLFPVNCNRKILT